MRKPQPVGGRNGLELEAAFKALAHPIRRQIVEQLLQEAEGSVATCSSFDLAVTRSTLTQHIRTLTEAGFITTVDHGNRCEVTLRADEIEHYLPGILDLVRREHTGRN
ncbi:ArsR/SmtB family transcription factor [Streptomyces mirabilis]